MTYTDAQITDIPKLADFVARWLQNLRDWCPRCQGLGREASSDTGNEKDIDRLVSEHSFREEENSIIKERTFQRRKAGVFVTRGDCIIINQIYENNEKYRRAGTEKDAIELIRTWEKLGCKNNIMVEKDLTSDEIIEALTKFRHKLKRSLPDFMVIIILGHGKRDTKTGAEYIMDVHMNGVPISKIKNMFIDGHKCPSMIGRPKMFFIQACRGIKKQTPQDDTWIRYLFVPLIK